MHFPLFSFAVYTYSITAASNGVTFTSFWWSLLIISSPTFFWKLSCSWHILSLRFFGACYSSRLVRKAWYWYVLHATTLPADCVTTSPSSSVTCNNSTWAFMPSLYFRFRSVLSSLVYKVPTTAQLQVFDVVLATRLICACSVLSTNLLYCHSCATWIWMALMKDLL